MNTPCTHHTSVRTKAGPRILGTFALIAAFAPIFSASSLIAQAPSLGAASGFAVLGASTVSNAGLSIITGDVGVAPGTAITGFPPGVVNGTVHPGDAVAIQANADLTIAYNALLGTACTTVLTGQDLGGMTLTSGTYCFAAAAQLTGTLTLDAQGSSSAVFVFQTGSTLTTAAAASIVLANGATADNVFWQVGSSATLGTANSFAGNVVALASITVGTSTTVTGRLLAVTAAVTMDTNTVSLPGPVAVTADWNNFGIGWAGTGGMIPTLVLDALPVLGTTPWMVVQNVRGSPTFGLLLWGTGPVSVLSQFGGDFQVQQVYTWPTSVLPVGSLVMPLPIPLNVALSGLTASVQVLQYDEGASNLVAFTRGLRLHIGQ